MVKGLAWAGSQERFGTTEVQGAAKGRKERGWRRRQGRYSSAEYPVSDAALAVTKEQESWARSSKNLYNQEKVS